MKNDCLVTIQNLSKDDIRLIILRKDVDGNKFFNRPSSNVIESGKIGKYNEKILDWGQLRILQAGKKIFIRYSPAAEDVFETSRFDLLDLE